MATPWQEVGWDREPLLSRKRCLIIYQVNINNFLKKSTPKIKRPDRRSYFRLLSILKRPSANERWSGSEPKIPKKGKQKASPRSGSRTGSPCLIPPLRTPEEKSLEEWIALEAFCLSNSGWPQGPRAALFPVPDQPNAVQRCRVLVDRAATSVPITYFF